MRKRAYIIRARRTDILTLSVVERVYKRDYALAYGRHLSKDGREVTVRRASDGVLIGAFQGGSRLDPSEIYLDDFAHMAESGDVWHHLTSRPNDLLAKA
jgi:hypothetical protein